MKNKIKMRPFEYYEEEGDGFYFCGYCGSNHVKITLEDGTVIEQGDLYRET